MIVIDKLNFLCYNNNAVMRVTALLDFIFFDIFLKYFTQFSQNYHTIFTFRVYNTITKEKKNTQSERMIFYGTG